MKIIIRILLVLASGFMVWSNWSNSWKALSASGLFLTANLMALIYNELKPRR